MNIYCYLSVLLFCMLQLSCTPKAVKHSVLKPTESAANDFVDPTYLTVVRIGPNREIKTLDAFLREDKIENVHIILDEGNYYSKEIWLSGNNIILEGTGRTSLLCKQMYENVLWISGQNIVIKNLHMKHFAPGILKDQNCTGRVIAFDHASNVLIEGCDLNGCGLAGLHDNLGNRNIVVKDNYIHNNSEGAYTDHVGNVWQTEIDNHAVFKFKNNRLENNGTNRISEVNAPKEYIIEYGMGDPEILDDLIQSRIASFKDLPSPIFAQFDGVELDHHNHLNIYFGYSQATLNFGNGDNDYSTYKLFDEAFQTNPQLEGKVFKIYWEWRIASFPCCEGETLISKSYLPSILKLEHIE